MQHTKQVFCLSLIFFLLIFVTCSTEQEDVLRPIRYSGNYNTDFNDKHDIQLAIAQKIGIQPLAKREDAEKLKGRLKKIQAGKNYEIDELTHSIPFLIPQAATLLNTIAANFADSLISHHAPHYKLIVTSITRTQEDVKQLRKRNGNATSHSTHLYGTTFDISWKRFAKADKSKLELSADQLKKILASVLRDLKKEKACYVKHEKQQACFHITVR